MKSFTIAKADLNYLDNPQDQLDYILKDLYEANNIPETERVDIFYGMVEVQSDKGERVRYNVCDVKTLFGLSINNPYLDTPLTVHLGYKLKKNFKENDIVLFTVNPGKLRGAREAFTVKNYYSLVELGFDPTQSPIDHIKQLCDNRQFEHYHDKLVAIIENNNDVYDANERLSIITQQLKTSSEEKEQLEGRIETLSHDIEQLELNKKQLSDDVVELQGMTDQLPQMREERDELEKVLPALRTEKESIEKLISQQNELKKSISDLTKERERLEENLPKMRQEKEQLADVLVDYLAIKDKYELMKGRLSSQNQVKDIQYDYVSLPQMNFSFEMGGFTAFKKRCHFDYPEGAIMKFLLALRTMQIITLCGDPGTGKSTFVSEMCCALGAKLHMIEVQNNWTDRSDILGYYNPLDGGKYQSTPFLDALLEAKDDLEKNGDNARLHIICLDEMNLARVEYYFATFLSKLQQKDRTIYLLPKDLDRLAMEEASPLHAYCHFDIPSNVRFTGNLNMDETAQNLSHKVIDRCFFIEFASGKSDPQIPEGEKAYYPAALFSEPNVNDDQEETGVFLHFISENHRFKHYAQQMYLSIDMLDMSEETFADYIVSAKVLPRIRKVSDFDSYRGNMVFGESNDRFALFETYGDDGQLCDYWRRK